MTFRLDGVQRRALSALCSRIVPHADSPALAEAVETRLAAGDPVLAKQVALLLTVFDHPVTALATGMRVGRFSSWPAAEQDAWLSRWEASALPPMRTIFQAFRRLVLSTCYASPSEYAGIGFRGPLHDRDAVVAWEGALPGTTSDAEMVLRVPDARVRSAHRDAAAEWIAANQVPAGVVQGHEIADERRLSADVCVVGTGAGGAVVAARLAEHGLDVVVLEEGGYWTASDFTEHEADMVPRLWADAGARATDDLSLSVFQGRAVGGSTTINWMIMLRAPDAVLDEWADEHGMEGMQGSTMAAAYDRVERDVHARMVAADAHAPHNSVILDGAAKLGWHARAAANNAKGCVRAGFCGVGCRYGAKQGTLVTYVPRALAAGARLYSDARVDTVSHQGGGGGKRVHATVLDRTTGAPRGTLVVDARIVVLSAGAVGTPAILQRSGMGGGGVGKYLRVHPTTAIVGRYDREMYAAAGIPQSALCDHFIRGAGNAHGFWIESPALLPGLASVALPGFGAVHRETMRAFPQLSSLIALVRDGADRGRSNGSVRVDRAGRPHIAYRLGDADRATLLRGIEASARLHFAAGASEVLTLHSPSLRLTRDSQLAEIARRPSGPNQLGLFTAHMNGTCRIGRDATTSGCGPDGQRHGVPGLYVADGSLFPTAPGVNPQNTIMAMAHILAERIAAS